MKSIPKLLSKTKLMRGYRCEKCIYLTIHNPQFEAAITPDIQALFDQGNHVGAEARKYFPGGTLIDNVPWDFTGALARTRELLAAKTEIIYEAAFEYMGCYARADIIKYSPETQRWKIYEVKSTTKVKPDHLLDVGLQTWIMAKSGLPIEQIHIMHLNPECRFPDLSNLFKQEDVTAQMRENYLSVQPKIRDILTLIRQPELPTTDIGPHCLEPTECGFIEYCWKQKNIPAFSTFDLPNIRERKWDLYHAGIMDVMDERLTDLNEIQTRVIAAHHSGMRYLDHEGIKQELLKWQFPLVFLDFETINPAIPRYDGCGPFHHTPFQFSVHTLDKINGECTHEAFLHDDASDPRPNLIPALLDACAGAGSIVAYFSEFEKRCIQSLADYSPQHREALESLIPRLVDPLPIMRKHVYDPGFAGSFSLKKVAPALLGDQHSYENMAVANGGDAQRAFEELISPRISAAKKAQVYQAMLDYCNKDTLVMVELVKWMYKQIEVDLHRTQTEESQQATL